MCASWICTCGYLYSIFNFQKAYQVLDELIISGELQESSKKSVLRVVLQGDGVEETEQGEEVRCTTNARASHASGAAQDSLLYFLVDRLDHALR